ncbi:MAG: gamma-glutamylcyclotransferase [Lachnospiraceae bacterium]|nr:gamma-glutamylcyclotransferase [Lachnospiraceae bacterium]
MSKSSNVTKDRFYIAYGSNLNLGQMAKRCPTAEVMKATYLQNYRLMFRGKGTAVATIEKHRGSKVPILIWRLQPNDEHNLDIYEGYPHLYRKEMLKVTMDGRRVRAMVYIMNETLHPYGTPSRSYFDTICQGYGYSGFDGRILRQAVLNSVWEAYLAEKYEGGEMYDRKN